MQVAAFLHSPLEGTGSIAGVLERHNIACLTYELYANSGLTPSLSDAAGLILMGGPMSVNDDLPWIAEETRAIQDAIRRGKPVLGICLGAQLIAKALGAKVYPMPAKEIGWAPVFWTEAGLADPLFRSLSQPETLFHWHGETFDLPEGAERLAYSEACGNQAFRISPNVYALQFHAEVTPAIIKDWCRADENCGSAREMTAPIDPYSNSSRLQEIGDTIFDLWCALLRSN